MNATPRSLIVRTPGQLAAVAQRMVGYEVTRSLIIMAMEGNRPGMIVRVDLPDTDEDLNAVAAHVIPALIRHAVAAVTVLAFEDTEGESTPALESMTMACTGAGITVETVAVAREGMAYTPGHPFTDPSPVALTPAQSACFPSGPLASRDALSERFRAAVPHEVYTALQARQGHTTREDALSAWAQILTATGQATPVADLPAEVIAHAALALAHVTTRDALMAWLTPGTLPLDLLPTPLVDALKATLPAATWAADPQDRERLRERVRAFCRCIPDAHAVPVLTLTAHLEWWAGDGALSRTALDLARALDPDYRLAALLDRMLTEGIRVGEPLR